MRNTKKKHRFLKFIIFILILGVAFYFANKEFNIIEKFNNKNLEKKEQVKEKPKLKIINEDSNSRVIAVMINNIRAAWPHSGLDDAFLNYEIIVEGGITRIMSLFRDKNTERIGSIRSARHYFLDYALENDAIYVHFGHSPEALNDIKNLNVDNLNGLYLSKLYWRDKSLNKATEHTAFTSIEKINNLVAEKGYRTTSDKEMLLNYTTDIVDLSKDENSIKADKIEIVYSSSAVTSYEYDNETRLYKRFMKGIPHTDYITKEQYTTKNIITYQVKNYTSGSAGRQSIDNIGTGNGYYITNGYAIPIKWEKTSRTSKTIYIKEDGSLINVNDGVTWIQIQPKGKSLKIEGISEVSSNSNENNI